MFEIWGDFAKLRKKNRLNFPALPTEKCFLLLQWVAVLKSVVSLALLELYEIKEHLSLRSTMDTWEDAKTGIRGKTESKKGIVKKGRGDKEKLQVCAPKRMQMERYNEHDVVKSRAGTVPGILSSSILFELVSIGKLNVKHSSLYKRRWMKLLLSSQREKVWS